MKSSLFLIGSILILMLASCIQSRTPFTPDGPVTVGMPKKLSDRERTFFPQIDTALRNEGLIPVRHGKGDLQLEFTMSSGPIRIRTSIALLENGSVLHSSTGRAGGVPFVNREEVARESFDEAFADFQTGLSNAVATRVPTSAPSGSQGPTEIDPDYELPVY